MSVGAGRAKRAVTLAVRFADRYITREAEAETFAEEGGEGELVEIRIARRFGGQYARGGAVDVGCHGDSMSEQTASTVRRLQLVRLRIEAVLTLEDVGRCRCEKLERCCTFETEHV